MIKKCEASTSENIEKMSEILPRNMEKMFFK